jgi:uncharacterized protein YutE (UPF0331/DUF86 family)
MRLLVSIQASIDIANHLIAASSSRRPETYREGFMILCDEGLLQDDLPVVNRYRDLVRAVLRDRLLPE